MNKIKFTSKQIRNWNQYERIRKGGHYNMLDPRARRATFLSEEDYGFVMDNFSELKEQAEAASALYQ